MKVWVVTEFADFKGKSIPVSCEIFSKKFRAYDFANRDSKMFRIVTEKIVDRYIAIKEA